MYKETFKTYPSAD